MILPRLRLPCLLDFKIFLSPSPIIKATLRSWHFLWSRGCKVRADLNWKLYFLLQQSIKIMENQETYRVSKKGTPFN